MPRARPGLTRLVLSLAGLLVLAACGSSSTPVPSSTPTPSQSSATASTPTPAPQILPPSAHLILTGSAGLNGPLALTSVECNYPSYAGPTIRGTLAPSSRSPINTPFELLTVTPGSVTLRLTAGNGAAFTLKQFTGSNGISAFGGSTGVTLNTPLQNTTPSGQKTGSLGTVSHISGTLTCNAQTSGSSTLTFTGSDKAGPISTGLNSVKVECTPTEVEVFGLFTQGPTSNLVSLFLDHNGFTLLIVPGANTTEVYTPVKGAVVTTTSTGATINASATAGQGAAASTIKVQGQVVCGSTTTPS